MERRQGTSLSEADEAFISAVAGISFIAGADTTVSTLLTFILGMIFNPDVQRLAQEEIDRVVGLDRLPDFEDRKDLPYVEAVCKESMRWQSVTPFGVPHMLTEDDTYNGYFFPAGTIVVPNQWAMLHDPNEYPEPFSFKPERFLSQDGRSPARDPTKIAFGFGRRICPGRHMADNTTFLNIASILAVFNISKAVRRDGTLIEPKIKYISSLVSHPEPFECKIIPRSERCSALAKQAMDLTS